MRKLSTQNDLGSELNGKKGFGNGRYGSNNSKNPITSMAVLPKK